MQLLCAQFSHGLVNSAMGQIHVPQNVFLVVFILCVFCSIVMFRPLFLMFMHKRLI